MLILAGFAAGLMLLWYRRRAAPKVLVFLAGTCGIAHLLVFLGMAGVIPGRYFDLAEYLPLTPAHVKGRMEPGALARFGRDLEAGRLSPEVLAHALNPPGGDPPSFDLLLLIEDRLIDRTLPGKYLDAMALAFSKHAASAANSSSLGLERIFASLVSRPELSDSTIHAVVESLISSARTAAQQGETADGLALLNAVLSGRCTDAQYDAIVALLKPVQFRFEPAAGVVRPGTVLRVLPDVDPRRRTPRFSSVIKAEALPVTDDLEAQTALWDLDAWFMGGPASYVRSVETAGEHTLEIEVHREVSADRLRQWGSRNPGWYAEVTADLRRAPARRATERVHLQYQVVEGEPAVVQTVSDSSTRDAVRSSIVPGHRSWIRHGASGQHVRQELSVTARPAGIAFDVLWKCGETEVSIGWFCMPPAKSETVVLSAIVPFGTTLPVQLILRPNLGLARNDESLSPCYDGEDIVLTPRLMRLAN